MLGLFSVAESTCVLVFQKGEVFGQQLELSPASDPYLESAAVNPSWIMSATDFHCRIRSESQPQAWSCL
jgi:hypothetical protein